MRAWLIQRLSAVYLSLFLLYVLFWWLTTDRLSYTEWRQLIGQPFMAVALGLFFSALLVHAWVGMRDVLVDYIPHIGLRFFILIGVALFLLALGIWVALILVAVVMI